MIQGNMYKENRTGSRIEPWGTPHMGGTDEDNVVINKNSDGSFNWVWSEPLNGESHQWGPRMQARHVVHIDFRVKMYT